MSAPPDPSSPPGRRGHHGHELFDVDPGAHEAFADLAAAAGARIEGSIHEPGPAPKRWVAYVFLAFRDQPVHRPGSAIVG